jgi:cytochrome d ubiquinol oxidase subunit II
MWNANETWLLVAAGSLFGAFPEVYSIMLNALYIPGMIIVVGLILRAVSFEFYDFADFGKAFLSKTLWSKTFGIGSLLTVLGQGMLFGGLFSGIPIVAGRFGGDAFTWATPLTTLITIGFLFAYAVLGYAYLIKRTDYELHAETFPRIALSAACALVALVSATLLLPKTNYLFFMRWSTVPSSNILTVIACLLVVSVLALAYATIKRTHQSLVYYLSLTIFALGYVGMIVGTYPYMLPPNLTLTEAASPSSTLRFMLYGIGPLLPIIFTYNWYLAHVFRKEGKKGTASY